MGLRWDPNNFPSNPIKKIDLDSFFSSLKLALCLSWRGVSGVPVLTYCCLFFFSFCLACRISGGARPRCVSALPHGRRIFFLPLLVLPLPRYSCIFRGICFSFVRARFSPTFFFFSFLFFLLPFIFFSFQVSGLLAYVCRTCRVQYDGMLCDSIVYSPSFSQCADSSS